MVEWDKGLSCRFDNFMLTFATNIRKFCMRLSTRHCLEHCSHLLKCQFKSYSRRRCLAWVLFSQRPAGGSFDRLQYNCSGENVRVCEFLGKLITAAKTSHTNVKGQKPSKAVRGSNDTAAALAINNVIGPCVSQPEWDSVCLMYVSASLRISLTFSLLPNRLSLHSSIPKTSHCRVRVCDLVIRANFHHNSFRRHEICTGIIETLDPIV